jgi:hypothetical protein
MRWPTGKLVFQITCAFAPLFAGTHDPPLAVRAPYWKIPLLAGMFDPDAYHR